MRNDCLGCFKIWEDEVRHHYCPECHEKLSKMKFDNEVTVIHKIGLGKGENINKGHLKDIQSRVIDDEGNVLKGSKGIAYMKSKGDKYAGRLKSYYEAKI